MSGTSQAAAVVSGIAALVLQANPALTPDEVKCALISTAKPAHDLEGNKVYSIFQQGAGLVDVIGAVDNAEYGCANAGLDVDLDLAGIEHYAGPAGQDENGNFILIGEVGDGYTWDGTYQGRDGIPLVKRVPVVQRLPLEERLPVVGWISLERRLPVVRWLPLERWPGRACVHQRLGGAGVETAPSRSLIPAAESGFPGSAVSRLGPGPSSRPSHARPHGLLGIGRGSGLRT